MPLDDCRIIDAHFHHWNTDVYWRSALEGAARRGIFQIWVSGLHGSSARPVTRAEILESNRFTLSLMRMQGSLFRGFVYVDPTDTTNALDDVRRATEEYGMIGIKLWVACFCDDKRVFPIAEYAVEHRLPILVHAWDKITGNLPNESTAAHVARLANRFPDLPIIMAHHGGDWIPAARHIERFSNVLTDTSGTILDHGLVDYLVHRLGPERVLFGTDCSDFETQCAKVAAARISDYAKKLIFAENAMRVLGSER